MPPHTPQPDYAATSPPMNGPPPPPRSPQPTLKDVARAAKVSPAAVSYVLNNSLSAQRISPKTRRRIWLAAERLGYKSNPIGRALQRGYSNQVTLLMVSWNLAISHAATAMAISRHAARHGLALTVQVVDDDSSAEKFIRRTSLHNLGGILALWDSPAFHLSALPQLAADGVPVIDLLPGSPHGLSVVTADREDAAFRATRLLLDLGHRHIALIGDAISRPKTTSRKLAGYRRALLSAHLPFDPLLVQDDVTQFGFEGGHIGFSKLARRCPHFTALFCINDAIALGAIDAAHLAGRSCPADLSVVGFGDSPEGSHSRPSLTTFALSSDRVAAEAIHLILQHRRSPSLPPSVLLLPEELIPRASTGPAPAPSPTRPPASLLPAQPLPP